jgi:hypothetical protein
MGLVCTEIMEGTGAGYLLGEGRTKRYFTFQGVNPLLSADNLAALVSSVPPGSITIAGGIPPQTFPAFAAPHPTIQGMYAAGFDGEPWPAKQASTARNSARICVTYMTPSSGHPLGDVYVELRGSNGQMIFNRWAKTSANPTDVQGQPILVAWSPFSPPHPAIPPQIPPAFAKAAVQIGSTPTGMQFDMAEIPGETPNAVLYLTRMEPTSVVANQNFPYRRSLNSTAWQGFEAHTVFLRDIVDRKVFGFGQWAQPHYIATYEFEIAPDPTLWTDVVFFRDVNTGKPVIGTDITDGTNNGYTLVDLYPSLDFNDLNFPAI